MPPAQAARFRNDLAGRRDDLNLATEVVLQERGRRLLRR
jgi:hypothetical protein